MKNKCTTLGIIIMIAVVGMLFVNCEMDHTEWTSTLQFANSPESLGLIGTSVVSSDKNVATVKISDNMIKITAVSAGTAIITVSDSSGNEATITITISKTGTITTETIERYNPSDPFVSSTNDSIINNDATLGIIGISVISSDTSKATVEIAEGKIKITSVSAGSVVITVSDELGRTAAINVTVAGLGAITIRAVEKYDNLLDAFIEQLAALETGTEADPVTLKPNTAITFTNRDSVPDGMVGWGEVNAAVLAAQKYISLDLSECTFVENTINSITLDDIRENEYIKGIVLPATLETIESFSFSDFISLTSIIIGDSVTTLEDYAFYGLSNLINITIPDGVTSIGSDVFSGCTNLESVIIGNGVISIEEDAFRNCENLTNIIIPDSVTSIGNYAFYECTNLKTVTIGDGVTSIGEYAFRNCENLTNIIIPDSVTSIGNYAFYNCTNLTNITIGDGVTFIGSSAFSGCSELTNIIIPNSVTSIGNYAFSDCTNLETVTIGDGVTTIGSYAFSYCSYLTNIIIPDSVTSIGNNAFYDCTNLKTVTIGDGVTSIGSSAFSGCSSLTDITVEDSNPMYASEDGILFNNDKTSMLKYPEGKSGSTYTIPDNVTSIGVNAFYGSNLTSITIGIGITSIDNRAFYGSGITSIIIGDGVTSIEENAFGNCENLTSVTIGNNVTSIGDGAFSGCSLISMTIPASVTFIGEDAFYCLTLTSVTVDESNTMYASENGILFNKDKTALLLYPAGKGGTTYIIPDNITSIGYSAFSDCIDFTNIVIPESITFIEEYAFWNCENLTNITFEGSDVDIGGDYTFAGIPPYVEIGYDDNTLREAYSAGGAGTYSRTAGQDNWVKQ
jgi:hypothetical protein